MGVTKTPSQHHCPCYTFLMFEYKVILATLAALCEVASNFPYIRDILRGTTKPHLFTWFVWTLLTGISFFILVSEGAGSGAWVTGVTTITCCVVAILALFHGERHITRSDWVCFLCALLGIVLWKLTDNSFLTIIIILSVDTLGFIPTVRKSFYKPYEETLSAYVLVALKHLLTFTALQAYTPTTMLYTLFLFSTNTLFVSMLLVRRLHLKTIAE